MITGVVAPWIEPGPKDKGPGAVEALATKLAQERQAGLQGWGIDTAYIAAYRTGTHVRVITPGADAGEMLHVLSSLERRSNR